jgi:hypothetical protein
MARVNVFLKDELLKAIDAEAADVRMKRSALIQAALAEYLADRKRAREEAATRRDMEAASGEMDGLAEKLGSWDPVKVIRDLRDRRSLRVREPGKRYRTAHRKRRA